MTVSRGFALRLWRQLVRWVGGLAKPRRHHSGRVERGVCFSLHHRTSPAKGPLLETLELPGSSAALEPQEVADLVSAGRYGERRLTEGKALRPLAKTCRQGVWVSARIRDQDGRDVARVALWPDEEELRG